MDKHGKGHRLKSVSTDEEEDFESADDGEENEQPDPLSWKATSADGSRNSTSRSQVTQSSTLTTQSNMDSVETVQGNDKAEESMKETGCSDSQAHDSQSTNVEDSTNDLNVPSKKQVPDIDDSKQDDSDDGDIQSKSDEKEDNEPSNLQKDETDVRPFAQEHKDSASGEEKVFPDERSAVEETQIANNELSEQQTSVLERKNTTEHQEEHSSSSWGWGGWGSMLSQATAGLSSVIESVESSLGIPEPEVIAKKVTEDEKSETVIEQEPTIPDTIQQEPPTGSNEASNSELEGGQGYLFSGLSSVVLEGLGALEYIGKKTMDAISEGDPGLRNKRQVLLQKGPSLSQMLREAKEEAEYKAAHPDFKESVIDVKLTTEFDKFQGLAHLEALEILSKESESRVEGHIINLSKEQLIAVKPLLRTIQEVVQIEDEEDEEEKEQDFETEISSNLAELHLSHIPNKSKNVHSKIQEWIDSCIAEQTENPTCKNHVEIYTAGISALAELTACSVEQFHKIAEVLLLLTQGNDTSALVRAQSLKKLTLCVCREVSIIASKFAAALNTLSKESENPKAVESLITTLYLVSSDSSHYVQHAFKLLCPVLQQTSLSESTRSLDS